mmetsp:Transcript_29797/g.36515  ORF Transcript_29797/g.36515 Transcript_29797/m.36515 type:complete len:208 (-) Transcript_29797:33-656(-)
MVHGAKRQVLRARFGAVILLAVLSSPLNFTGLTGLRHLHGALRAENQENQPSPESKEPVVGRYYDATVVGLNQQGAILDLGLKVRGFLHKSKLTPKGEFVSNIEEKLKLEDVLRVRLWKHHGNEVEVVVCESDIFDRRPPIDFALGEEVEGTVVKVDSKLARVGVGAVVAATLRREKCNDFDQLKQGDTLKLKIIHVDGCSLQAEAI